MKPDRIFQKNHLAEKPFKHMQNSRSGLTWAVESANKASRISTEQEAQPLPGLVITQFEGSLILELKTQVPPKDLLA